MSFSEFMTQYYQERLRCYEHLDLGGCTAAEFIEVGGEASSLQKFLFDLLEEGYEEIVKRLVAQTDALNRLHRFLPMLLQRLGPPYTQERFYLFPERIHLDTLDCATTKGASASNCRSIWRSLMSNQMVRWISPPVSRMGDRCGAGTPNSTCS